MSEEESTEVRDRRVVPDVDPQHPGEGPVAAGVGASLAEDRDLPVRGHHRERRGQDPLLVFSEEIDRGDPAVRIVEHRVEHLLEMLDPPAMQPLGERLFTPIKVQG